MVSIRICELQKVGQDHEIQRRRIRRCVAFFIVLVDGEKMRIYLKSFSRSPPT